MLSITRRSTVDTAPPRALYVAGSGWLLTGLACAFNGLLVQQTREGYPGVVGSDFVATEVSQTPAILWLGAGIGIAILAGLLVYLDQGWTVYPLVVLGTASVVALSIAGTSIALMAMAGLLVGTMPLGLEAAYRHLTGGPPA